VVGVRAVLADMPILQVAAVVWVVAVEVVSRQDRLLGAQEHLFRPQDVVVEVMGELVD